MPAIQGWSLAGERSHEEFVKRIRILHQSGSHLHTNVNDGLALEVAVIQAFA